MRVTLIKYTYLQHYTVHACMPRKFASQVYKMYKCTCIVVEIPVF